MKKLLGFRVRRTLGVALCIVISYTNSVRAQVVVNIAGNGSVGFGGDGGPATAALFETTYGLDIDAIGNLYIVDGYNFRLRKINTAGIVTTIAGTGSSGPLSGDGGPATAANVIPQDVVVDPTGNIYISDIGHQRVRKIDASGVITTVAGNNILPYGVVDGTLATNAALAAPRALALDRHGNLYVGDETLHKLFVINTSGIIRTIAGTGIAGYTGDGGPATNAQINNIRGITVDSADNVYIADQEYHIVRKINVLGQISTYAGSGVAGFSGDGGYATAAAFQYPAGLCTDLFGNLYIGDIGNRRIRKVDASGIITTFAGTGTTGYIGTGPATTTNINVHADVKTDNLGSFFFANGAGAEKICVPPSPGPITGFVPLCPGMSIFLTDTAAGGAWSTSSPLVATIDNITGELSATGPGITTIGYSLSNSCITRTQVSIITVQSLPDAGTITGVDTLCENSTISLANVVAGGIWQIVNPSLASITATGVISGLTSGTDTVNYIVTNSCGSDTAAFPLFVRSLADCTAGIENLLVSNASALYIYPNPNNGIFIARLSTTINQEARIVITNMLGEVINDNTMATNVVVPQSMDIAPGIYLVSVTTREDRTILKMIVE